MTRKEKIEIFKRQCQYLEHNAEMFVSDKYDIEPVIQISNLMKLLN